MSANTMEYTLSVTCGCGQYKATVDSEEQKKPTRLTCYCIDCQSYARHLGQAEVQLGANGGTDILQISPAQFSISAGQEHLNNLMLSPKGIYRWYASCCNTPICNTTTKAEMPYVGLLTNNISKITMAGKKTSNNAAAKATNKTLSDENRQAHLDEALGPVAFGVGAGEKHPISADWPVAKGFGLKGTLGTLKNMARWRIRGDHKRSIFIDSDTGKPLVEPTLLTLEQRRAAKTAEDVATSNTDPL